jgi:hypothetical protein
MRFAERPSASDGARRVGRSPACVSRIPLTAERREGCFLVCFTRMCEFSQVPRAEIEMAGASTRGEMYDLGRLKTVDDCRRVMERAKTQGRPDVYSAVFKRQCELVGLQNDDASDPLVRRFYETLAAYEQLLTEKNIRKHRQAGPDKRLRTRVFANPLLTGRAAKLKQTGLSCWWNEGCQNIRQNTLSCSSSLVFRLTW